MNSKLLALLFLVLTGALGAQEPLPERLDDTGLFAPGTTRVADGLLQFIPQYPLWSDGTRKRRWLYIPPGKTIDASNPDAWVFPPGTRAWKEFGYKRPIETRFIERLSDGSWRFAAYMWSEDGSGATLVPEAGFAFHTVSDAPGGRYPIPSREDCLACHDAGAGPLLGLNALQLSPDRDPGAPHAETFQPQFTDLPGLHARGLLSNLPPELLEHPPRITASTATGRSALGYMHSNCGICHNDRGQLFDMDFSLLQSAVQSEASISRTLASTIGRPSEFIAHGIELRLVPGDPVASSLIYRMRSRNAVAQMPPLGRRIPDAEAIDLVATWIEQDLTLDKESQK